MMYRSDSERLSFSLHREDRDLIIKEALGLDEELSKHLRFGVHEGKHIRITMPETDFDMLLDALAAEAQHAQPRALRRRFERLYDRLAKSYEQLLSADSPDGSASSTGVPPEIREELQRLIDSGKYKTIDEINRKLEEFVSSYNAKPRAEFGGLSPEEMGVLLYGPFSSPESGLQLNANLPLADLKHAEILENARVLLQELDEGGGTKATAKLGNLNRKFVMRMLDRMQWPTGFVKELWLFNKVVDEEDVFPLHVLRILLELSGLIRKRGGSFRVTKLGRTLRKEGAAGELFALLFSTFFGKFNLAYLDGMPAYPILQSSIPYALYQLARTADTWQTPERLPQTVLLPRFISELEQESDYLDFPRMVVESRILGPLVRFGLLEKQDHRKPGWLVDTMAQVRKTVLFDKFLQFSIGT